MGDKQYNWEPRDVIFSIAEDVGDASVVLYDPSNQTRHCGRSVSGLSPDNDGGFTRDEDHLCTIEGAQGKRLPIYCNEFFCHGTIDGVKDVTTVPFNGACTDTKCIANLPGPGGKLSLAQMDAKKTENSITIDMPWDEASAPWPQQWKITWSE
jgi:hypothetical protein